MNRSRFSSVSGPNTPRRSSTSPASANRSGVISIFPASTLVRSRMSLISRSRSEPEEWMIVAYSTCLAVRLPSRFCASSLASTSRLFSGVRSSWDMFARNCDLYRDARSSSPALSASSALDRCSSCCLACSSAVSRCDCSSSASVRALAIIVLTLTPMVSISCSRNSRCTWVNGHSEPADQRVTEQHCGRRVAVEPVPGDQAQPGPRLAGLGEEERAVLPADHRDELVHDQLGDVPQVALTLHQAGDPRQVGL